MNKLIASLQLFGASLLAALSLATAVNLIFISTRPETISVVNTMIGQGVLIICMLALANILFRKGRQGLKAAQSLD